ncbi:hypothetical protein FRX31_020863, partial [Thalictrum thalictroides]
MGPKRARVTPSTRNTTSSRGGGVRTRGGGSVSPSARATRASKRKAIAGSSQDPPPPSDSNGFRASTVVPERLFDLQDICSSFLGRSQVPNTHEFFQVRNWMSVVHPTILGSVPHTLQFYYHMAPFGDRSSFTTTVDGVRYRVSANIIKTALGID